MRKSNCFHLDAAFRMCWQTYMILPCGDTSETACSQWPSSLECRMGLSVKVCKALNHSAQLCSAAGKKQRREMFRSDAEEQLNFQTQCPSLPEKNYFAEHTRSMIIYSSVPNKSPNLINVRRTGCERVTVTPLFKPTFRHHNMCCTKISLKILLGIRKSS